jgi:hypothetical protein
MKRVLSVMALFGVAALLLATKNENHKISWCHFPPGQYPNKVLILSIDLAADGTIGPAHQNHQGDGPVCVGLPDQSPYDCVPLPSDNPPGPGIILHGVSLGRGQGLTATCLGNNPCPSIFDVNTGATIQLQPRGANGACACPAGTIDGDLPTPIVVTNGVSSTCAGANL